MDTSPKIKPSNGFFSSCVPLIIADPLAEENGDIICKQSKSDDSAESVLLSIAGSDDMILTSQSKDDSENIANNNVKSASVSEWSDANNNNINNYLTSKTTSKKGLKRPRTAYIIYLEDAKLDYFSRYPNATYNEYQKWAGKEWKSMSKQQKMVS